MESINYVCEGEIIKVNETPASVSSASNVMGSVASAVGVSTSRNPTKRPIVTYICRVQLSDGQNIICPEVVDSTMFGGIDDYLQIRRRATSEYSEFTMGPTADMMAHVGDRVFIVFINGKITRPVIIGNAQHPNQVNRFSDGVDSNTNPQMFFRYLGISCVVDEDGQINFTHFGAPKLKYIGELSPKQQAEAASSSVSEVSIAPSGYEGYEKGDEPLDEDNNKAVIPQDYRFKTTWEMLKSGLYRVRDSIGQNLTIDPEKSTIEITNNGIKSTDSIDSGLSGALSGAVSGGGEDAEVMRFDKVAKSIFLNSRKLTTIYTQGDRKDTTEGDYTKVVKGDESTTIEGDQTFTVHGGVTRYIADNLSDIIHGKATTAISGDCKWSVGDAATSSNFTTTVGGKKSDTIYGDCTVVGHGVCSYDFVKHVYINTKDKMALSATSDINISTGGGDINLSEPSGAGISISKGKVEIGGKQTGLFKATLDILEQLDAILTAIGSMTVPTGVGPSGPPINIADFIKAQAQLAVIKGKVQSVTGGFVFGPLAPP